MCKMLKEKKKTMQEFKKKRMFIPGWQVLCVFNHSTLKKKKCIEEKVFQSSPLPLKAPRVEHLQASISIKQEKKKQLCFHTQTINIYIYIESRSTFKCTTRVRVTVDPEDRSALGLVTSPGESTLQIADKF